MRTGFRLVSIARSGIWIPRYVIRRAPGKRRDRREARPFVRVYLCLLGSSSDRAPLTDIVWRVGSRRRGKGMALIWVMVRGGQALSHNRRGGWGRRDRRWNRASIFKITCSVRMCPIFLVEVHHPVWISFLIGRSPHWIRRHRTAIGYATAPIRSLTAVRGGHAIIRANAVARWHTVTHCALKTRAPSIPWDAVPCSPGEAMWKVVTKGRLPTVAAMKPPATTFATRTQPEGPISSRAFLGAVLVHWAFFGPVAFLPAPITTRSLSHSRRGTQAASRKLHAHQFALRKRKNWPWYFYLLFSMHTDQTFRRSKQP